MIASAPAIAPGDSGAPVTHVTVHEAARRMRCSSVTVRRAIARGDLDADKVAGQWLLTVATLPSELRRLLEPGALTLERMQERADRRERARRRRASNALIRRLGGDPEMERAAASAQTPDASAGNVPEGSITTD